MEIDKNVEEALAQAFNVACQRQIDALVDTGQRYGEVIFATKCVADLCATASTLAKAKGTDAALEMINCLIDDLERNREKNDRTAATFKKLGFGPDDEGDKKKKLSPEVEAQIDNIDWSKAFSA